MHTGMESSALTHAPVQRRCAASKARSRSHRPSSVPRIPHRHVVQRRDVAVGSAFLDVDWSQLSRLLLAPMLSAAAIRKATDSLAKRAAVDEVCRAFQVQDKEELQDLLAALVLSECVYKKLEMPPQQLADTVGALLADFPPDLVHLEALQLSRDDVTQNYLVAVGGRSLYVAFMGTKQARDISTDLAFAHEAIWTAAAEQQTAGASPEVPSAHRGFLARAKAVPVEELQALAAATGRRLVLCGHSLGGAVAKLAGLRLLRASPAWPPPSLRVICFATPAVGNDALARLVEQAGWGRFFKTYVMPEDQLMRVLRFTQAQPSGPASSAAATIAASASAAADSSASHKAAVAAAAAAGPLQGLGSRLSALNPVPAVLGLLTQPMVRESAQEQLRRELQAEEASTSSLDSGAGLDAAEGPAAAATAAATAAALAVASSSSGRASASSPSFFRSLSRRFLPTSTAAAAGQQLEGDLSPSALQQQRHLEQTEQQQQQQQAGYIASQAEQQPTQPHQQQGHKQQQQRSPPNSSSQQLGTTRVMKAGSASARPDSSNESSSESSSSSSSTASLSAQNQSLGVALDLQRRWVGYQLMQLGRAAVAPISSARRAVSPFYPFGVYRFLTSDGVLHPDAPLPALNEPLSLQAAAFGAYNQGVISFHRMIAHRTRCVYVVGNVAAALQQQGLLLPPSFRNVARFAATYGLDIAGATPLPPAGTSVTSAVGTAEVASAVVAAAEAAATQAAAGPKAPPPSVRLGGVVPSVKVPAAAAVARPPLAPPPLLLRAELYGDSVINSHVEASSRGSSPTAAPGSLTAAGSSIRSSSPAGTLRSPSGSPYASPSAGLSASTPQQQQRRGPLSFLPSVRSSRSSLPPAVPLTLKVSGANLRPSQRLSVVAYGEQYPVTVLSSTGNGQATSSIDESSSSSSSAAQVGPQQQLGMVASVLSRAHESLVAAGKALEGERPRWRPPRDSNSTLTLQVLLPAPVVEQLTEAALAAARQQSSPRQLVTPAAAAGDTPSSSSRGLRKARSSPALLDAPAAAAAQTGTLAAAAQRSASLAATAAAAGGGDTLQLVLKTDLQELSLLVVLQPHVVGVVGSSSRAALLLSHLLNHSGSFRQQYTAQAAAAAAAHRVGATTSSTSSSSGSGGIQRWLPSPGQRLRAAAGAAVAAQRLTTLSAQLIGKQQHQQQVLAYGAATVGAAAGVAEPPQGATDKRVRFKDHDGSSSNGDSSSSRSSADARPQVGPLTNHGSNVGATAAAAARVATSSHVASSSMAAVMPQHSAQPSSRRPRSPSGSSSGSGSIPGSSEGLRGVLYTTLPVKAPGSSLLSALQLPAVRNSSSADSSSSSWQQERTVSQVLKRATKQLQQQQAAAASQSSRGLLGFMDNSPLQETMLGFMQWLRYEGQGYNPVRFLAAPAAAAGAAASRVRAVLPDRRSSSSSHPSTGAPASSSSSSRPTSRDGTKASPVKLQHKLQHSPTAAAAAAGRASPTAAAAAVVSGSPLSRQQLAAKVTQRRARQQQQQQQQQRPWDVMLLAVSWDADFITLLRHRSALSKLAAAAADAGVRLVPVLLLEGEESAMSVRMTDLRAIGAPLYSSKGSSSSTHHQQQQQDGLLYLEDAMALLAGSLQVPSGHVHCLPLQGLLLPQAAATGSNSSSGGVGGVGMPLSVVGGLEDQYQLLSAVQVLEGRIAGLLQQQQQQPVGMLAKL